MANKSNRELGFLVILRLETTHCNTAGCHIASHPTHVFIQLVHCVFEDRDMQSNWWIGSPCLDRRSYVSVTLAWWSFMQLWSVCSGPTMVGNFKTSAAKVSLNRFNLMQSNCESYYCIKRLTWFVVSAGLSKESCDWGVTGVCWWSQQRQRLTV